MFSSEPHRSFESTPMDTLEEPAPTVPAGAVSIWRTHSGQRRWSVKVAIGTSQADLDKAIDVALAAERRLGGEADK